MVSDFDKKGNRDFFNRKLLFKTLGIIFLVFIFVLVIADFKMYQRRKDLALQIDAYKKQIEDIKKSSQSLKDEINNSDNIEYLEKIAYEQLGQQRPGEKEVIFVMPEEKSKIDPEQDSFWSAKFWLAWFSNSWQWIKNRF